VAEKMLKIVVFCAYFKSVLSWNFGTGVLELSQ
jgi:hypothetical protein